MLAHDTTSSKDCIPRGATAMMVDLSKLCSVSEMNYGELIDDPVCFCSFEKAFSAAQLIFFGTGLTH